MCEQCALCYLLTLRWHSLYFFIGWEFERLLSDATERVVGIMAACISTIYCLDCTRRNAGHLGNMA